MNFPKWAPPALIRHYNEILETKGPFDLDEVYEGTLLALTTNPDMEKVWNSINKRLNKKHTDCTCIDYFHMSLFQEILSAIEETELKVVRIKEDVARYEEIAKAARKLADMLKSEWIVKGLVSLEHMNQNKDALLRNGRMFANSKGFFINRCAAKYPEMRKDLESMAQAADKAAKHEATRTRIAEKVTISTTTIFIRALYPFWLAAFGGPLYRTFAALCRLVLNDSSIDQDKIKRRAEKLQNFNLNRS